MSINRTVALFCLVLKLTAVQADALQDGQSAILRKDYPTAVQLLLPLAEAGNAQAQLRMGLLHYHGHGVRENDAQALAWFEQAARQGLAEAQFHLGNMYAYGLVATDVADDSARLAAQWYFEAARQGHADAQYSLGILFLTGTGLVQNETEARRWIEQAARQGHADARAYLKGPP
jgi:TPR repeat protein